MSHQQKRTVDLIRKSRRIDPVVDDEQIMEAYQGTWPWMLFRVRAAIRWGL